MTWTTIPRWLYENDLPDGELQAFYVTAARRKVAQLEAEGAPTEQVLAAKAFLAQAERALRRYERRLPGA
jgi:hypothetical protein